MQHWCCTARVASRHNSQPVGQWVSAMKIKNINVRRWCWVKWLHCQVASRTPVGALQSAGYRRCGTSWKNNLQTTKQPKKLKRKHEEAALASLYHHLPSHPETQVGWKLCYIHCCWLVVVLLCMWPKHLAAVVADMLVSSLWWKNQPVGCKLQCGSKIKSCQLPCIPVPLESWSCVPVVLLEELNFCKKNQPQWGQKSCKI